MRGFQLNIFPNTPFFFVCSKFNFPLLCSSFLSSTVRNKENLSKISLPVIFYDKNRINAKRTMLNVYISMFTRKNSLSGLLAFANSLFVLLSLKCAFKKLQSLETCKRSTNATYTLLGIFLCFKLKFPLTTNCNKANRQHRKVLLYNVIVFTLIKLLQIQRFIYCRKNRITLHDKPRFFFSCCRLLNYLFIFCHQGNFLLLQTYIE